MKKTVTAPKPFKRKLIQLYAALLYNAHIKGFFEGEIYTGPIKNICVPGINCYSCPGAIGACPLGALQNALASSTTRAPAYMLGIIMLFGLLLGRTICGFLCPFGLIQELLYKIPTPKLKKSRVTRALSWLKYVILISLAVAFPLAYSLQHFPVPGFCKYICPAGTLEGAIGLLSNPANADKLSILNILFTRKFIILVLILLGSIFIFRIFCRFICPLGAIYGLFCRIALIGVHVDENKCTGCGLCVRSCKMDVRRVGDHECINCGECVGRCPAHAISFHVGNKNVGGNKNSRRAEIAHWAAALVLLAGVLIYVNQPAKKTTSSATASTEAAAVETAVPETEDAEAAAAVTAEAPEDENAAAEIEGNAAAAEEETAVETQPEAEESSVPVGCEVGMRLPDFTAPIYGGEEFSSAAQRGKILVINFWATWCTPCVNELPYFEQLAADYSDSVTVIAMHSSLVTEDVDAWIAREGLALDFALDETGSIITSFGGSTMLPMTVVVDPDGIIVYNAVGAVEYEKLVSLVEEAGK